MFRALLNKKVLPLQYKTYTNYNLTYTPTTENNTTAQKVIDLTLYELQ